MKNDEQQQISTGQSEGRTVEEALPTDVVAGGRVPLSQIDPTRPTNQQNPASLLAPDSAPEHHRHNPDTPFTQPGQETTVEANHEGIPVERIAREEQWRVDDARLIALSRLGPEDHEQ